MAEVLPPRTTLGLQWEPSIDTLAHLKAICPLFKGSRLETWTSMMGNVHHWLPFLEAQDRESLRQELPYCRAGTKGC